MKTTESGARLVIEFYHPAANSLPGKLLQELAMAFESVAAQPEIHVVVLESTGDKAFCAGASFDELLAAENQEQAEMFFSGFARVLNAIRTCPVPVVARVQGKCVGGGVGLVAACDYVVATPKAQVKLSELAIGIGAYVIGPAVRRKMGTAAFSTLSLRPDKWFDAAWALENHLFSEVVNPLQLDDAVHKVALTWAGYQQAALTAWRAELWQDTAHWETLLFENAAKSASLVLREETRKKLNSLKK